MDHDPFPPPKPPANGKLPKIPSIRFEPVQRRPTPEPDPPEPPPEVAAPPPEDPPRDAPVTEALGPEVKTTPPAEAGAAADPTTVQMPPAAPKLVKELRAVASHLTELAHHLEALDRLLHQSEKGVATALINPQLLEALGDKPDAHAGVWPTARPDVQALLRQYLRR